MDARREFIAGLGGAVAWPVVARGQSPTPVIGLVDMLGTNTYDFFAHGLTDMGFVDGRNVVIDHRQASEVDQLPTIAVELVRNKVAAITAPTNAIIAAKAISSTVPMVFIGATDPIAAGIVASFNRPGGNVTGVRLVAGDLPAKQVQLIHELLPETKKLGFLIDPRFPNAEPEVVTASEAAHQFGLITSVERVTTEDQFEPAFQRFEQTGVGAVLLFTNVFFASHRDRLTKLALDNRTPMIGQAPSDSVAGALASYGTNYPEVFRQAGTYVGRILKGEKPADLPVLQPTTFNLVINLKTAKSLGIIVPSTLLARADEVIE
jgi:putative tryptophan/tyrosine transport system substrate-binding protein